MAENILITGTSGGLGQGLALEYLQRGDTVYGLSRRPSGIESERFHEILTDLFVLDTINEALDELIGDARIATAILSAGVLGQFKTMPNIQLDEMRWAMDINVWANKLILDWFAAHGAPQQIALISSGASIKGNKGWGSYALSKATLNMLTQLYAHDLPDTHLIALAPGLVATSMQDRINDEVDADAFPSVQRLKAARGTPAMPGPQAVARSMIDVLPQLREQYPSGEFVDLRQLQN